MLWTVKRLVNASWRRAYSAQPSLGNPYPFRKLRAYPFALSPDAALNQLSAFASCFQMESLKGVSTFLSWYFPKLGFSASGPARFEPVYFPGWFLDVELEGQVAIKGDARQASAQIHHAYIPGSDYKILSSAALAPSPSRPTKSVPFSEDLLRQHDTDIACIPYNISPFSILDIASLLSYTEAIIEPNFRLKPSTLKASLFAAYPILIPLYLAQYEVETQSGKQLHTMFIEAYDAWPNVWSEPLVGDLMKYEPALQMIRSVFGLPAQSNRTVFNMTLPKRFLESAGLSLAPFQTLGQSLSDYLEKAINRPGAATTLAVASAHNFDKLAKDRRIREFTPRERDPVIKWFKFGSQIATFERAHKEKTRDVGNAVVNGTRVKRQNQQLVRRNNTSFLDKLRTHQADRLKIKPNWALTQEELEQKEKGPGA